MEDGEVLRSVQALVDQEHELRARASRGELAVEQEQAALRRAQEQLDQCWDLLRQRWARREYGQSPGGAATRPVPEAEAEGHPQ